MSYPVEDWVNDLHILSNEEEGGNFIGYRNWGFTIYRTGYTGSSSDQQWQQLLQTIQTAAHKGALSITGTTEQDPAFQELWSLFWLDAREDPALLAGLNIDQLRDLYNSAEEGGGQQQPMNWDYKLRRVFLFADDEVLSEPTATANVKCVDADYRAENYISRNPRVFPQRYFGWMPMRAGSVAELWSRLNDWELSRIAPPTIGGSHLVVWDGVIWC
jgi:hypothetical protein